MRLVATIHDPAAIRRLLAHLALSYSGQSPGPAPPAPSAAALRARRFEAREQQPPWFAARCPRPHQAWSARSIWSLTAPPCPARIALSQAGSLRSQGDRNVRCAHGSWWGVDVRVGTLC